MSSSANLDDVVLAMDVVDTLRHRARIVEHEFNDKTRRADLIDRLRKIYAAQGIEVSDAILEDGVTALEERRFSFKPVKTSSLGFVAKLYVCRSRWGRPLLLLGALTAFIYTAYFLAVERPRQVSAQRIVQELTVSLPSELDRVLASVRQVTNVEEHLQRADVAYQDGQAALAGEDVVAARKALTALEMLEVGLRREYDIRVVSRPGEYSGVFRIPDDAPDQRNYYLIVEALSSDGSVLSVHITSEEDQSDRTTTIWGLRVPKSVFDSVAADKGDDQIIQQSVIGRKRRGELDPEYFVDGVGGAILEW